MNNPIVAALTALIDSSLPWREYLNLDQPAPYPDDALTDMIEADANAA